MREVMPVRKQLGVRTLFNILGPLTNPAGARRQLLGVYSPALVEPIARVLLELGAEHALVVHGSGLDEITTTGETEVAEVKDGRIATWMLVPEEVGLRRRQLEELRGGDAAENARSLETLLRGELPADAPFAEVTALNAGGALLVAGLAADLGAGVRLARECLASGAAFGKLEQLRSFTP
jgi:anthranilate phosphoribosyltransferase